MNLEKAFKIANGEDILSDKLNEIAKRDLLKPENINDLAIVLTHYLFRNGPIEDMHTDGKLSSEDMQILNKYMVNKLAGVFQKAFNNEWTKLKMFYSNPLVGKDAYGESWDSVVPDTTEIDLNWEIIMKDFSEKKN